MNVWQKKSVTVIPFNSSNPTVITEAEIANDEPICIHVDGEYLATLVATPDMLEEMAAGYLLTSGIIRELRDVKTISVNETDVYVSLNQRVDLKKASVDMMNLVVSACSSSSNRRKTKTIIPQVESIMTIKPKRLVEMLRELNRRGRVYSRTRGTHSAMICKENGDVLAFSEDVGRHNAIDKVVGALFLGNEYFGRCVLLSTGRQSSEMILKAAYAGIPLVASMTVPLISGVRMAEETGVTLTSISGGVLQIYSGVERIKKENSF